MGKIGGLTTRLFGELAIIVLGVLIALWADGFADSRAERLDLGDHLRAVRDELRDELSTLERLDNQLDSEAAALRTMASLGVSSSLPPDSILIDLVYSGLLDVTVFEPGLSALDDLQSSGLAPLIDNLELRLALSQLRQTVRTAARNAEVNRTGPQQQLFDPFVVEDLPFVWRSLPAIQDAAPWAGQDMAWQPLFEDRGQALVAMRYDLLLATKEDWDRIRDEIGRLIGIIDAEYRSP